MSVYNQFDFFLEPKAENFPFSTPAVAQELAPYLATEQLTPRVKALRPHRRSAGRAPSISGQISQQLQRDIRYLIRMEPGVRTPDQTGASLGAPAGIGRLAAGATAAACGLAARFVSGYLISSSPTSRRSMVRIAGRRSTSPACTPVRSICQRRLDRPGSDVRPACAGRRRPHSPGLHPGHSGAASRRRRGGQIRGAVLPPHAGHAHLRVAARRRSPYTEEQWAEVLALGEAVDRELEAGDVRLTMGGRRSSRSTTGTAPDGVTDALLGPTKRGYATRLDASCGLVRLGGFLHFGQRQVVSGR